MNLKQSIIPFLFYSALVTLSPLSYLAGQDTIYLNNPSFEDMPRAGTAYTPPIKGWEDCGYYLFPNETPPDIHSKTSNAWSVAVKPQNGETYLGLVVRYNGTFESVSQKFQTPIKKDSCYSFSIWMTRSEAYKSGTRRSTTSLENFIAPAVLRIWGGNRLCARSELMAQSIPIDHAGWKEYSFVMRPMEDHISITLEAYFDDSAAKGYNGHILVDNLSQIVKIKCD